MSGDSAQWIDSQIASSNNQTVSEHLSEMKTLYTSRLWHQLTGVIENLLSLPFWEEGDFLIQLYNNFIKGCQTNINLLKLAQIGLKISSQYTNDEQKIEFLNSLLPLVEKDDAPAFVLLKCNIGLILKRQNKIPEVKEILEASQKILDESMGVEPAVNASYYFLSAEVHQLQDSAADYYRDMLLYLSYVPENSIPIDVQRETARTLCIYALVGDVVFNFGELLNHPVFGTLKGTPSGWIAELVSAFNAGNIDRYKTLVSDNRGAFDSIPILKDNQQFLIEKVTILALMESVFRMESERRTFTFAQVASLTQLPTNEVEFLLMRSLSLGLIRGSIDQVDGTVAIHWVQPRVLEMSQLSSMKTKLIDWQKKVDSMNQFLFTESPDLMSG